MAEIPKVEVSDEIGVIVPLKAIRELRKLFKVETVKVSMTENQIFFTDDSVMLSARLIEGEFPKYEMIIPKDNHISLHFDTETLLSAVRRVSLLSNSSTRQIILEIQDGLLKLYALDGDIGEAYEEVKVDAGEENIVIAFDSKGLLEILSHIDSETVVLNLKAPLNPAIIKPLGNEGNLYLIAPMKWN